MRSEEASFLPVDWWQHLIPLLLEKRRETRETQGICIRRYRPGPRTHECCSYDCVSHTTIFKIHGPGTLDPQEGNDRNQDLFKFQIPSKIPTVSVSVLSRFGSVLQQERIWNTLPNICNCASGNLATVMCYSSGNMLHFQHFFLTSLKPTSHQILSVLISFEILRLTVSNWFLWNTTTESLANG